MSAYLHYSHHPRQGAGFTNHPHGPGMSQGMDPMRHGHCSQPMGYPGFPTDASHYRQAQNSGLFGFANERVFKGLLIGAAAAYLLTNKRAAHSHQGRGKGLEPDAGRRRGLEGTLP